VNAGLTVAIAIGVPLGAVVGNRLGWRMTFVGVAVISAAAVVGLLAGLPARAGAGMVTATLRERVRGHAPAKGRADSSGDHGLAVGTYTVYSFIASFLATATRCEDRKVGYALFLWGARRASA